MAVKKEYARGAKELREGAESIRRDLIQQLREVPIEKLSAASNAIASLIAAHPAAQAFLIPRFFAQWQQHMPNTVLLAMHLVYLDALASAEADREAAANN